MALQQRGRALTTPTTGAVTGAISHFANRFAAAQKDSCPFSLTSNAGHVGLTACPTLLLLLQNLLAVTRGSC